MIIFAGEETNYTISSAVTICRFDGFWMISIIIITNIELANILAYCKTLFIREDFIFA